MTEKLLKIKAEKSKPKTFIRADAHKKKRLGSGWRKPKGLQNKMRLHKKGYRLTVKPGYGTPAVLRDTTAEGKSIVRVSNKKELLALNPKKDAALLAKIGRKNKEELITLAQEKNITLVNIPVKRYLEKTAELNKNKAEIKKAREEKAVAAKLNAERSAQKSEKKAATKSTQKSESNVESDEEKKAAAKKEQDKILTSKKGI